MEPSQEKVPDQGAVNWAATQAQIPDFETTEQRIAGWETGTSRPFAGIPRSTERGYEHRMRKAYNDTVKNIQEVIKKPQAWNSHRLLGQMGVQATGFVSKLEVNGDPFDPEAGPQHLVAGLPAIVAGRYRQLRETEEGEQGMAEFADREAKFKETGMRMTQEEIDMCIRYL